MRQKHRTFTPVDLFVQTYAIDNPRDYEYSPGVSVSYKTSIGTIEDIEELLDAVKIHGLRIQFIGEFYIFEPTDDGEDEEPLEEPEEPLEVVAVTHVMTPEELRAEADRIEEEMKTLEEAREPVRTYEEIEASQDEEEAVEIEVDPEEPEEEPVEIRSIEEIDQL